MIKLDLREVPFSRRGSYLAVSYLDGVFNNRAMEAGLYLRTVRGFASTTFAARIVPVQGKEEVEYTYEAYPHEVKIMTGAGEAEIAFADADTVIIRGNIALKLDWMTENDMFSFAQPWREGGRDLYLVNCFRENSRYMLRAQQGIAEVDQRWSASKADYCHMYVKPEGGEYLLSIEENYEEWCDRGIDFCFEEVVRAVKDEYEQFYLSMPAIPAQYEDAARICSYVEWASIVAPSGLLKREAMYMSKNWMCNVWSWDHCFNAMSLAYENPKEAWDQFMIMFDFQKESGNIPDSVNDVKIINNYCKPPIHGWALRKLMKVMSVSRGQLEEAYKKISSWTSWWLNSRDENGDGLCEYTHGNDSGWDNSTAFKDLPPATLPDLAAFLILQMDVLGEIAEKLNYQADAEIWKLRADDMLEKMITRLFKDDRPCAWTGLEMEEVETDSLILCLPIILGKRLPEKVRKYLIEEIKGGKFNTAYGLATESPSSMEYEKDGYWRGPIWAPSTMIILDGMMECGEKEFVQQVTHQFCRMVQQSGCAENFDALTGEGLRDRAYTWTASVMLVMAHEYLR